VSLYTRPPSRGQDRFFHPASEADLVALVRLARHEGRQLRVRGAGHSVAGAIYSDGAPGGRSDGTQVDVRLDRYAGVSFDEQRCQVTVQAGCHLGADPRDHTGMATWERSLLAQLERRGWALPDLGGVTHQTVSGFLMTGSSGGSVQHAIEDAVVAWRLIDGTGRVHELRRGTDDLFDAVSCSVGLLGVVSAVTLQCQPRYDILGREDIRAEDGCDYAPFDDGEDGLESFLRRAEYARLMWWPQEGVRRIVTWQARRMQPADYDERTGPPGDLRRRPYSALGDAIREPRLARAANLASQAAGGLLYDAVALAGRAASMLSGVPLAAPAAMAVRGAFAGTVLPALLRQFVPEGGPQRFWDSWCHGLPMDNQMSETFLPTTFTEIWLPLERAGEVMRALRDHYRRGGYEATGAFLCEVYAARETRGWLHPGHARDSLRIDLFWFARNPGDPARGFFVQFWELLRPFGYRLHLGKYLPIDAALGSGHLRRHTPRWDDFLALRARLDPDGVFLTRYWRTALGTGP
jgi:FAD/FMN-containing dehydrogenase